MKKLSDASKHRAARSVATRRKRQNVSDTVGLSTRITARLELLNLKKWVRELQTTHGKSYRWIAKHTTRGEGSHGYWQSVATGAHLLTPRRIAPTMLDLIEIRRVVLILREYREREIEITEAALRFHDAMVGAQSAAFEFVKVTSRRRVE